MEISRNKERAWTRNKGAYDDGLFCQNQSDDPVDSKVTQDDDDDDDGIQVWKGN